MSYKMQFDLILILFVGQLPDIKGMFWTLALFFLSKPLLFQKKDHYSREKCTDALDVTHFVIFIVTSLFNVNIYHSLDQFYLLMLVSLLLFTNK